MKKQLTLALVLATTLTFTACDKWGGDVKLLECIADESGKCLTKFEYDKQNRIVKIHNTNDSSTTTITYADNLITLGNKKFTINGNTITEEAGTYTSTFTIDKDGYIVSFNDGVKYTYKDGNKISSYWPEVPFTNDYYYDDKKSPFSNSNTPKWLFDRLSLGIGESKNNVVEEIKESFVYTYKYEYDSDGFPVVNAITSVMKSNATRSTIILRFIYRSETQNVEAEVTKFKTEAAKQAGGGDTQGGCPNAVTANGTLSCGGKTYKTVKIGEQVWMAENLNYDTKTTGSVCYENNEANCQKYGRLYNWNTAMKVCPIGWHLPSIVEWQTLVDFLGGETAGKKLKATSGWNDKGNGEDKFGFSALPGGYCTGSIFNEESYKTVGVYGFWWSAAEYNSYTAPSRNMRYDYEYVGYIANGNGKNDLLSVRCLQGDAQEANAEEKAKAEAAALKAIEEAQGLCPNSVTANGTLSCGGKTYKTVKIGEQVWMVENLNYEAKGSKCPEYDTVCKNGRHYDWNTALKVCPIGWHLPTEDEWRELLLYSGNSEEELKEKMKSMEYDNWWTASSADDAGRAIVFHIYSDCGEECYHSESAAQEYTHTVRCVQN